MTSIYWRDADLTKLPDEAVIELVAQLCALFKCAEVADNAELYDQVAHRLSDCADEIIARIAQAPLF